MSSSLDGIRRVLAAFERSDWAEIDVRSGGVRVHLATGAPRHSPSTPLEPARAPEAANVGHGAAADAPDDASSSSPAASPPADAHVVASPSPGTVWRSPQPGAPPFADVGDTVDASATLCIVEVMKLMSHVKAGVSGEVVAVYARNGETVAKGEALFSIASAGSSA